MPTEAQTGRFAAAYQRVLRVDQRRDLAFAERFQLVKRVTGGRDLVLHDFVPLVALPHCPLDGQPQETAQRGAVPEAARLAHLGQDAREVAGTPSQRP